MLDHRIQRRRLLKLSTGAALAFPRSQTSWASSSGNTGGEKRRRWIWIINNAGETVATAYRDAQGWNLPELDRLSMLFRDIRENARIPINPDLIETLSLIQESWGFDRPIYLASGYRTVKTNSLIEAAAPDSLHLSGNAADITIKGVTTDQLAAQCWRLAQFRRWGGVGYYPNGTTGSGFVHVDVGDLRSWTRL